MSEAISAEEEPVRRKDSRGYYIGARTQYGSPWPHRDPELIKLWGAGTPILQIAATMRITPGAVSGRAHRIGLQSRGVVIKVSEEDRKRRKRTYAERKARHIEITANLAKASQSPSAVTSVVVQSDIGAAPARVEVTSDFGRLPIHDVAPRQLPRRPAAAPRAETIEPKPVLYGRVIECTSITKDGAYGRGWEFCGKPSKPGKSFCEDHCNLYLGNAPWVRMPFLPHGQRQVRTPRRAEETVELSFE